MEVMVDTGALVRVKFTYIKDLSRAWLGDRVMECLYQKK